ncbi:MAG: SPOR domain-containing protein [Pseudomonadota bacterium]
MANIPLRGQQPTSDDETDTTLSSFSNIIGACLSVAILVLLVGWGSKTLMRDASGVPMVSALEGPMRVAPTDPGVDEPTDLGLSVNAVASNSEPVDIPSDLRLAPPPVSLTENVVRPPRTAVDPDALATNEGLAQMAEGLNQAAALVDGGVTANPAVASSIRPAPRTSAAQMSALNFDIAVPSGSRLAQLGAFVSRAIAEQEWARLSTKHANFIAGKSPVIQIKTDGPQPLYRLRVTGFATGADARRFCTAISAKGDGCFPVIMP